MPIEEKIDSQLAMTFPPAAYGMFSRICEHFWTSGCAPLPIDTDQLRAIARAHVPTWRNWEAQIRQAFEEIRPRMEHALEVRGWRSESLAQLRERSLAARKIKKLAERENSAQMSASARAFVPKRKAVNSAQRVEERTAAQEAGGGFVDAA